MLCLGRSQYWVIQKNVNSKVQKKVVCCPGQLLPSASLKWNTIYPLKYENEYAFQTLRVFLLFIKGPACICNLWLCPSFSQSYQGLYFNVVSVSHLTDISLYSSLLPFSIVKTLGHSYSALPIKLFSNIVCYFLSLICLFLLIFSPNLGAPMVQCGTLPCLFLFCH